MGFLAAAGSQPRKKRRSQTPSRSRHGDDPGGKRSSWTEDKALLSAPWRSSAGGTHGGASVGVRDPSDLQHGGARSRSGRTRGSSEATSPCRMTRPGTTRLCCRHVGAPRVCDCTAAGRHLSTQIVRKTGESDVSGGGGEFLRPAFNSRSDYERPRELAIGERKSKSLKSPPLRLHRIAASPLF